MTATAPPKQQTQAMPRNLVKNKRNQEEIDAMATTTKKPQCSRNVSRPLFCFWCSIRATIDQRTSRSSIRVSRFSSRFLIPKWLYAPGGTGQLRKNDLPLPLLDAARLWFIYQPMQISTAIRLMREPRVLRHFSFKTEKTYVYWLGRYGAFLHDQPVKTWTTEGKVEPPFPFAKINEIRGCSTSLPEFRAALGPEANFPP